MSHEIGRPSFPHASLTSRWNMGIDQGYMHDPSAHGFAQRFPVQNRKLPELPLFDPGCRSSLCTNLSDVTHRCTTGSETFDLLHGFPNSLYNQPVDFSLENPMVKGVTKTTTATCLPPWSGVHLPHKFRSSSSSQSRLFSVLPNKIPHAENMDTLCLRGTGVYQPQSIHNCAASNTGRLSSDASVSGVSCLSSGLSARVGAPMSPFVKYMNYMRHHSTRASPVTVQWLLDNYESADGVSLSRSALYSHYLSHCLENWLEPMNPASFGKLIRSIFVGLRTRRLGTRGNSKYHYYGIRMKSTSSLNQVTGETRNQSGQKKEGSHSGGRACPTTGMPSAKPEEYKSGTNSLGISNGVSRQTFGERQRLSLGMNYGSRSLGPAGTCVHRSSSEQRLSDLASASSINHNGNQLWRGWDSSSRSMQPRNSMRANSQNNLTGPMCVGSSLHRSTSCRGTRPLEVRGTNASGNTTTLESESLPVNIPSGSGPFVSNCALTKTSRPSNTGSERTYFGSSPHAKFRIPDLMSLCQMAKLTITEADLFSCNIKTEPYEYETDLRNTTHPVVTSKTVAQFVKLYEAHCEKIYSCILNLRIEGMRTCWQQFWRSAEGQSTTCSSQLSKEQMITLCEDNRVCHFLELADRTLYQSLLELIINDSLKAMSMNMIHGIRTLIKLMEPYLRSAIRQFPANLANAKLTTLSGFTKGLRRALGLSHLSQAVLTVIKDPDRMRQMVHDITKLDLVSIEAQGSWASECSLYAEQISFSHPVNGERTEDEEHISDAVELDTLLASPAQADEQIDNHNTKVFAGSTNSITENLETAVVETHDETMYDSTDHMEKNPVYSGYDLPNCDGRSLSKISMKELHAELCTLLTNRAALPVWTSWLDRTVSRTLADQVTGTKRASAARHLMLVWTYYSSLLMRELTLRSAASFSSCHLLRMWCDEYLSYRLEQVASSPSEGLPKSINQGISADQPEPLDDTTYASGFMVDGLVADGANTLTSLNDRGFECIDCHLLSSGYEECATHPCFTPLQASNPTDGEFPSKSPDIGGIRLFNQDIVEYDRPSNEFVLGFGNDPLLTESSGFENEKQLPLIEVSETWSVSDSLSQHMEIKREEETLSTQCKDADLEFKSVKPEHKYDTLRNQNEDGNAQHTGTGPQRHHFSLSELQWPTRGSGHISERQLGHSPLNSESSKENMHSEKSIRNWMDSTSLSHLDPVSSSRTICESESISRRFMKPFNNHTEKRIVASLQEDLMTRPPAQTPRKTVCITLGADEQSK
ncbi:regulatory factor X 1/2/3 [Clonorchis sinensis]|uniref:Regulatory factor X 1/2/3 n=1 Tax=Clonorchis sinensis TaxID=79923 RepID=G7YUC6_CLOSI|nr:regulatory factor X 1/2/3 [Clonorchis sinensis]